jgi:putative DNA primase/helicase
MGAQLSLDEVLLALQGVQRAGANWKAKCPAHEDTTASLSITQGDTGAILFKCFAGCSYQQIITALGFTTAQLTPSKESPQKKTIIAVYDYKDADGTLLYQSVRYVPKDFRQRRPDGKGGWEWNMRNIRRVPYRLPELKGQHTIYIVEGEKDVDTLWNLGCPATTNTGGAGKWKDSDSDALKSAGVQRVILIPDHDDPGREHMTRVAQSVKALGFTVVYLPLPGIKPKGDVTDWLMAGHTKQELETLVASRPQVLGKGSTFLDDANQHIDRTNYDPKGAALWPQSDLGAAEAFVARYGERIRYNHKHKEWLLWNCHHWKLDRNEEIRRKASTHVRAWQHEALELRDQDIKRAYTAFTFKLERNAALSTMVDLSRAMEPCADTGEHWDDDPFLVGCPNGVIDLRDGTFRDGNPDDRITLQTGTAYNESAACERWENFLREVFCEDDALISFIHRAIGYSLSGDTREQCFFMCVGHGANGKSTLLSVLSSIFGDYGYTTDTNVFASNAGSKDSTPYDLAELLGRRLVLMSEAKTNSKMNEQSIKNFTGGERINAQKKFGHPFEFQPVGKLWMGINHQPKVTDDSHGFWRRVRLIPFTRTFAGSTDNRNLKRELIEEAPGILAWAVRGARAWLQDGLQPPPSVMKATDAYQESEDPILDFILERTEQDSDAEAPCTGTYLAYKDWAKDQGLSEREMLLKNGFGRLMSKRFDRRHALAGWRYLGVRLKVRPRDLLSDAE